MNIRPFVVLDFETGDKDISLFQKGLGCEPIQLAAVVIHPRRLTIIDEFSEMMRALQPDKLQDGALAVNKKTREEIAAARHPEAVWKDFTNFVTKHNWKKTAYTAPICCGFNIRNFDFPIVQRLCELYGPTDKKTGRQSLFSDYKIIDVADDAFRWWENSKDLPNEKLSTILEYVGVSTENAHDALVDVKNTAALMIRFLRLYRNLYSKITFKESMKPREQTIS